MKILRLLCFFFLLSGGLCRAGFGTALQSYNFGTADIVRDTVRDRVYCAVPSQNSVVVIDSDSLQVLATIFTGSQPNALAESPDGSTLYVANLGSSAQGVTVVDLPTLTVTRSIATTSPVTDVAAAAGTIYTIEGSAIRAYKASDGTALSGSLSTYQGGVSVYGGTLAVSADGRTLYYYQSGLSPSSWYLINVNSWPGTLTQSGTFGSNGESMALSADGQYVTFVSGAPYQVDKLQASNPTVVLGVFSTGPYPRAATYSRDGNTLFTNHTSGTIDVWNANTYLQTSSITTTGQPLDLQCDRQGRVLFAGTSTSLTAYYIGSSGSGTPMNVQINPAVEIRWDSVSGSLYQVEWRSVLSGSSTWYNLGGQIVGNGLTMSLFDTARDSLTKFYRVVLVSP
jgi:YVTN family beta-propeller protein